MGLKCCDLKVQEETKKILQNYAKEKDKLVAILNDVQEKYGYIPKQRFFFAILLPLIPFRFRKLTPNIYKRSNHIIT